MSHEHDEELVTQWMRDLAALPVEASRLPDPSHIWLKAQLLRRWDAQQTALAPLEWGERAQVLMALVGAVALLALAWSRIQVIPSPAGFPSTIIIMTAATLVFVLTVLASTFDRNPGRR
jgi:hypothetical protein